MALHLQHTIRLRKYIRKNNGYVAISVIHNPVPQSSKEDAVTLVQVQTRTVWHLLGGRGLIRRCLCQFEA